MNLRYKVIKEIAINLASLGILMSWLSGFFCGKGVWLIGVLIGTIYLTLDNIASRLWFWVLEHMKHEGN